MRWWWRRRVKDDDRRKQDDEHDAFMAAMTAGGYREWSWTPPTVAVVECRRFEWPHGHVVTVSETSPLMNVAGLYWRACDGMVIDADPPTRAYRALARAATIR